MSKIKKRWIASFRYHISGFPILEFNGRKRFLPSTEKHGKALLALGVFSKDGDCKIFYSAPVKLINSDGTFCWVDKDGIVEYETDKLDGRYFNESGRCILDAELRDP